MARGRQAGDTKLRIMRAAETLFAERGIDGVPLREIGSAAGQANKSVVAYHFGSRLGLVNAIVERHTAPMQERWVRELDLLQAVGAPTLRVLVDTLVRAVVEKIDDGDGGYEWLAISAQLTSHPTQGVADLAVMQSEGVLRLAGAMLNIIELPSELVPLRMERVSSLLLPSVFARARHERGGTAVSRATFQADLVDLLVAVIGSPPSPETRATLGPG